MSQLSLTQSSKEHMNHINSPDNTDPSIERSIQALGLNAPRITPAVIQANIVSCHYFTAAEGLMASIELTGTTPGHPAPNHDVSSLIPPALDLLTICVLVLRNGFTVMGKSACASPENFDADIGKRIARANAEQEIWSLMGYALKERMQYAPPAIDAHVAVGSTRFSDGAVQTEFSLAAALLAA